MLKGVLLPVLLMASLIAVAQSPKQVPVKELQKREDSLKSYALSMLRAETAQERMKADSMFTRMFVRALVLPHSIDYPFDSLITVSKLSPADSSFRIYTWQLVLHDDLVRQKGAIQMRTRDGSLKLFPLIDLSDYMISPADTVTNHQAWFGAVYYEIITKIAAGKPVYTLLGYDENNSRTNKKVIEILTFPEGRPVFGGAYFHFPDSAAVDSVARYFMEYKRFAGPRLTYDREKDMIVLEHLISESNEPLRKETYVGDGDYDAFAWRKNRWVFQKKIFDVVTPEGEVPVPVPVTEVE